MKKNSNPTIEKILNSAEKEFHELGFKGARTTRIAKDTGLSRTMLHYYFRTKEELFNAVMDRSFGQFMVDVQKSFENVDSLQDFIYTLIDLIHDMISLKPSLPTFIFNIMNENPTLLTQIPLFQEEHIPELIEALMIKDKEKGIVDTNLTGEDLLLNIYGVCYMPSIGASFIKFKENRSDQDMVNFIESRREKLKNFVWSGVAAN